MQGKPAYFGSVVAGGGLDPLRSDLAPIDHGDGSAARVSARVAKGVELRQLAALEAGLLEQFSPRGVFKFLVHLDEAAGNRPLACERFVSAAYEEQTRPDLAREE